MVLTNGIILAVVVLLIVFGDTQAGLFIGLILFINMAIGTFQAFACMVFVDKLQSLTAPKAKRINPGGIEEEVLDEQIQKGDLLKLKIGDQTLCDENRGLAEFGD